MYFTRSSCFFAKDVDIDWGSVAVITTLSHFVKNERIQNELDNASLRSRSNAVIKTQSHRIFADLMPGIVLLWVRCGWSRERSASILIRSKRSGKAPRYNDSDLASNIDHLVLLVNTVDSALPLNTSY